MRITDIMRKQIETLAKEAAMRAYKRSHANADEAAAWRYALRAWRSPEFIQTAADVLAITIAIDEAAAAPLN